VKTVIVCAPARLFVCALALLFLTIVPAKAGAQAASPVTPITGHGLPLPVPLVSGLPGAPSAVAPANPSITGTVNGTCSHPWVT
jgi:hypothetical protein